MYVVEVTGDAKITQPQYIHIVVLEAISHVMGFA